MHEQQLQELRRGKWRLNGRPIRTLDEAREFIDSVGFCLLYPQRPAVLAPTFVGAYAGSDEHLPARQMAFADPSARDAKHLMVRLLREKAAYEANVFPDNNFIVSASVFPYFYGLVGDRNPRQAPKAGARSEYSPLAIDAFQIIQKEGPISEYRLRELLGREAISALQAARELSFVHVAGRVLLQVSSVELPAVHPVERKFKLQPRFVPQPPQSGKPLVQRRPRKSASPSPSRTLPPVKDTGKE